MKRCRKGFAFLILPIFLLAACTTMPLAGPSMPAYIGEGKTVTQFDGDDVSCRQLAHARTGVSPGEAMQQSQAGSAVLGALLGAALGAGIGGALGGGRGAGIGAASGAGLGLGTGLGTGTAAGHTSAMAAQQRYDAEYWQCMYARGHKVPGVAAPVSMQPQPQLVPPPSVAPSNPPSSYVLPSPTPPPASAPCRLTGRYVRTTQGFVEVWE